MFNFLLGRPPKVGVMYHLRSSKGQPVLRIFEPKDIDLVERTVLFKYRHLSTELLGFREFHFSWKEGIPVHMQEWTAEELEPYIWR